MGDNNKDGAENNKDSHDTSGSTWVREGRRRTTGQLWPHSRGSDGANAGASGA